jgi:hypothetical protein
VTITETDNQDGHVQLHATIANGSAHALTLPLYGDFVAVDDVGTTYNANSFAPGWHDTVPGGSTITGTIELSELINQQAKRLDISFTTVFGESAPEGGISVKGITLPS